MIWKIDFSMEILPNKNIYERAKKLNLRVSLDEKAKKILKKYKTRIINFLLKNISINLSALLFFKSKIASCVEYFIGYKYVCPVFARLSIIPNDHQCRNNYR